MFTHLHLHTPYSFLDGASEIEALVRQAASFGMPALAMTDHNSVAAAVKFTNACEAYGLIPILGTELTLDDGTHLTLLARSAEGYARICMHITAAFTCGGRLSSALPWEKLFAEEAELNPDIICLSGCRLGAISTLVRTRRYSEALRLAKRLKEAFGPGNFKIELQDDLTPESYRVCRELAQLADHLGVEVVATNNVHYRVREDFNAHDTLRCIAAKVTLTTPHPSRPFNAERYLKSEQEMQELFGWRPDALSNTMRIAETCSRALPKIGDITPRSTIPARFDDSSDYLYHLIMKGAAARYGKLPEKVLARLNHEWSVITSMGYSDYFIMVWEVVRWARKQGIRVTGRGSAADSCAAYALFLTDVDVIARGLPFARFLSPGKLPDIDMDFPSEYRDDVFRHIVGKYGDAYTGMVCTFHTFWARSAVRDIGKALELPADALEFFSNNLHQHIKAGSIESSFETRPELRPHIAMRERFKLLFDLCGRIAGLPRHLGTHSSGIVISSVPLSRIAPISPSARGITQIWTLDKDDAEELGAIKFDVLSLRTLSAIGDAEIDIRKTDMVREGAEAGRFFSYDRIPMSDPLTYKMFRSGSAVGTFQFESAAQMALAVVLQPEHFEDMVASVALIRPGPIRGHIVQRFTACRNGWMRSDLLHPALAEPLNKTYGCIVFQEQVNDVVRIMTACTDTQADRFRKSLTRRDKLGKMDEARMEFVQNSMQTFSDLTEERANLIFDQIDGWSGYGFTEGHAASFSLTGYRSGFLSVHHPAEYFAGLMNHQPMGYYTANTLAGEARRRGVDIRPVDINRSEDKCFAEEPDAIRLGLRLISELAEEDITTILQARAEGPFTSLLDFCVRVLIRRDRLENLILSGAFDRLHEARRGLIWRLPETIALAHNYRINISGKGQSAIQWSHQGIETPIAWDINEFTPWDRFLWEWRLTGVCADCHVFAYLREKLNKWNIRTAEEGRNARHGERITVAGLNVRPHRPPTRNGKGCLYTILEDETGMLQATCAGEAIDTCTPVLITAPAVFVRGRIQRRGVGVSFYVEKVKPLRISDLMDEDQQDILAERGWTMGYNVATRMKTARV